VGKGALGAVPTIFESNVSRRLVGTPPDAFAPGRFAHPTHWMADYAFANPPYGLRPIRRT
jgi:hypothetical protein